MTTKMEHRNNQIISSFFQERLTALVWASRVSGLNVDEIITECLTLGWDSLMAELEFLESGQADGEADA